MPISSRFVVQSTIVLLAVGFLSLLAIVGTTIWLGERAQVYFEEAMAARLLRGSAFELRDALRTAESSQRGYIATGNEIYLAPYDSAKAMVRRQLDALNTGLNGSSDSTELRRRLATTLADKLEEMDETIRLKNSRRDAEALDLLRSNRGKALMDEANVFLSGIILAADQRVAAGVEEQRANATMLRWVSMIGAVVIIFVIGVGVVTISRYTREIQQARDEVRKLNLGLEQRVQQRTVELERARDRAEVFLKEVNHRVANSLAMVASLVSLQSRAVQDASARAALDETRTRINAIALVHRRLYSGADARLVDLDEYLASLLDHLQTTMRAEGHGASLRYELEPLKLPTDASINLGVVVTEWVTNAFKYAYPGQSGEVRVKLTRTPDGRAELAVEDEGVGRGADDKPRGTGLGTRIVKAVAATMNAEIDYSTRQPGTRARLRFAVEAA